MPNYAPTKELVGIKSHLVRWLLGVYQQRLTRGGKWLLWPTAIFTAYGGVTLQIQGYVVFSYLFALWAVALLAMLLVRPRVKLAVRMADRACAGETIPVDVEVTHVGGGRAADVAVIPIGLPQEVDAVPEDGVLAPVLKRGESARVRLGLHCTRRGLYTLGGFRAVTDAPVGLLNAWRTFPERRQLIVYPKFHRLARLDLPTGRRYHPGGVALASSLGESFEYIGNRDFREGDNVRDIDWRATARLSTPIVREYRDEYFLRVAVILDTHVVAPPGNPIRRYLNRKPAKLARESFERAVSVAASVADFMARQEYLVDLFAAGPNLYHLTAGRSLAYLDQILDILACVDENPAEPFETIEPEIMENLSKITTVICVFLDWNENRRGFVRRLAQQGAGVKVILVRDTPPTLDPVHEANVVGRVPVIAKADFDPGLEEL